MGLTEVLLIVLLVLLSGGLIVLLRRGPAASPAAGEELRRAAEEEARRVVEEAKREAREVLEAARAEVRELKAEAEAEAKARLAEIEARLKEERARIEAELEKERVRLAEEATRERERLLAELERERAELEKERRRLEAAWEDLRREREELKKLDERLVRRGEQLDARAARLDELEEKLSAKEESLKAWEARLTEKEREIELKLEEVAGLTREEATKRLFEKLEAELEEERALKVKAAMEKARLEAKKKAAEILAQAIQRQASEVASQLAVSVVPIPSDAMKGRIIGREGRNIRAFEALTGVDLIIDDTPEAVILSSFNPLRREIARMALEELVADGRINPTRIEEVVEKAKEEMKHFLYERGEEAALEAGVVGLKPGLIQLLGRLHFRTSYGQNVLAHSIQVAHVAGILAAELGYDPAIARRAGLLHDIGKSVDREIEGSHVEIGLQLAKRFGEGKEVLDAIAHHHDPENAETPYAVLVAAADAVSAARPGARRESLEEYIKRLEQLEKIATSFPGVEQAFAVQAGREVRVIVEPNRVSDQKAALLAREIARRIERDMEYPGEVQVTVVRETRAVEHAR